MTNTIAAVICAAGSSRRMGGGLKKEYRLMPAQTGQLPGNQKTVLAAAVQPFVDCGKINHILVTIPRGDEAAALQAMRQVTGGADRATCAMAFVEGGETRQESVYRALCALSCAALSKAEREAPALSAPDYVLIHDGARPWLSTELIDRVIAAMLAHRAALPVLPLTETPKEIDAAGLSAGICAVRPLPLPKPRRASPSRNS
jgi:2-C-methyl-D-erythritol 4-phosphate cytidylyltransferase